MSFLPLDELLFPARQSLHLLYWRDLVSFLHARVSPLPPISPRAQCRILEGD